MATGYKLEGPTGYSLEYPTELFGNKANFEYLTRVESVHATSLKNPEDLKSRRDIVDLILKVMRYCNLDPTLIYLAINYVDRYLNKKSFDQSTDVVIAAGCLTSATKTLGLTFSCTNLKEVEGFQRLDAKELCNAEFDILKVLERDLESITPFGFLNFLVHKMPSIQHLDLLALEERASDILIEAQRVNEGFLEYYPSVIVSAAVLCAAEQIYPQALPAYMNEVLSADSIEQV